MSNPFENAKPVDLGSESNPDMGEGTHTFRVVRCMGKDITSPKAKCRFAYIAEVEIIESTTHRPGARCKYFEGFYKFPDLTMKNIGKFCAAVYGFDSTNPSDLAELAPHINELITRSQSEENILEGRTGKCVGELGKPSADGKRYPRYTFLPVEAKGSLPLGSKAAAPRAPAAPPPPAPPAPAAVDKSTWQKSPHGPHVLNPATNQWEMP